MGGNYYYGAAAAKSITIQLRRCRWGGGGRGGLKYCPIYIEFNLKLTKCLLLIDLGHIGGSGGGRYVCPQVPSSRCSGQNTAVSECLEIDTRHNANCLGLLRFE